MNPSFDNLRFCRDFLSRLLDLPPKEAIDALTNGGEDMVALFNEALGKEAFRVGDDVLANPDGGGCFMGTVAAIKTDTDGTPLFSVRDQEDDVFDCEASELTPDQD